jgi:hypothetical protein
MGGFWKAIGKGLATGAKGIGRAALWASTNPEIIQILGSILVKEV